MNRVSFLTKALLIIFHPLDCLDIIKRERKSFKILPSLILYLLTVAMNYVYIFIVHFPLSQKNKFEANIGLELAMVVVPLITWTIASYAITSIINGESHFTELFTAYSYALVPYIVLTPVWGVVSNLLSFDQLGLYYFFKYVSLLWVLLLLFLALKYLNDYTLGQTIGITFLSIIMMVIIWAVVLLLASLTLQLLTFFADVYKEFIYKL